MNEFSRTERLIGKDKLEKLKNLIDTYKDIKSANYTQPQLEDIADYFGYESVHFSKEIKKRCYNNHTMSG